MTSDSNAASVAQSLRAAADAMRNTQKITNQMASRAAQTFDTDLVADLPSRQFSRMGRGPISAVAWPAGTGFSLRPSDAGQMALLTKGRQSGKHGRTKGAGTWDRIVSDVEPLADQTAEMIGDDVERRYGQ